MMMVMVMMMMMAVMMPTCVSSERGVSDEVEHPLGHDRQVADDHGDMIGKLLMIMGT